MRTIVACTEGMSASSRDDAKTISASVKPILEGDPDSNEYIFREFNSAKLSSTKEIIEFVIDSIGEDPSTNVWLIGKSMGGIRTLRAVRRLFRKHLSVLNNARKMAVTFIDPHGYFPGHPAYYGKYRPIKIKEKWYNTSCPIRYDGVYQHNKSPMGAKLINAMNCENLPYCDHWNIISAQATIDLMESIYKSLIR